MIIEKKLPIPKKLSDTMKLIVRNFNENGFQCYLIGGSVRDLILEKKVYDYDFATDAHPEQVKQIFKRVIPTGIKHGTVTILKSGRSFEVTTYRADGKYIDGRRPETVSFSKTLEEDVLRRDFTINGLAFDLAKEHIIDYVDGMKDLENGIIRTIGAPLDRFNEDGLRPYRACRFAAKLDFTIEDDTFSAIGSTLDIAKKVSVERVRDEFKKLLGSAKPSVGIEYLRKSGLLALFLPELADCFEVSQNKFHIFDVYYHSIYSCDAAPRNNLNVRIAALLHDIGKVPTRRLGDDGDYTFYNHEVISAKMTRKILKRMKFSNEEISRINNLVLNHMFHFTDDWTDGAVRRFMRKVGIENMEELFILRQADRKGNGSRNGLPAPILRLQERIDRIIEDENAMTVKDLDINGTVLMEEFGLEPGPVIGKILNQLLEMVLDDPAMNKKEVLIEKAREIIEKI
ncbi:MAG TPA: HD domain-containing protein [Spirochaetota bacterium]|nr:HD domain-containing protein [Spirochaetota bacterium]HPI87742.1 HD domain-containing protein [Spirochaetota bacterium]HPR48133.1 HD domain-containing protein [Spirochaetota bacterium]